MSTLPHPNSGEPTPQSRKSRVVRRLPGACTRCRQRKIRCDASISGPLCTNCRLDGNSCIRPHTTQPPGIRTPTTIVHSSLEALGNITDECYAQKHQPFSRYQFLTAPRLGNLLPQDRLCLKWQNCLQVPADQIIDGLVRHYFRYVHPCLPVIDEGYFWRMYNDTGSYSSERTMSLLVFRAMLFAAASYIPLELAQSFGYETVIAARNSLYRSAKVLYDFGVESNSLSLAQAALLLTYHNSSYDQLTNSSWLSVAIHHACSINAHLYDHRMRKEVYRQSDLKRLWWSCIIRDRVLAIALRRPIQITEYQFDFSKETMRLVDLEGEIHHSDVYNAETKRHLVVIHTVQCQLAVLMTDIIPVLYPPTGRKSSGLDIFVELSKSMNIRNRLNDWRNSYLQQIESGRLDIHPSVSIHAHVTSLYYHSIRIALCHHVAFLLYVHKADWSENQIFGLSDVKKELTDAVKTVTEKVKEFIQSDSASQLPLAALVNVLLPNFLLRLNSQLTPLSAQDQPRDRDALWYYSALTKLCTERYGTAYMADCNDRLFRMFEIAEMGILREALNGISAEQNLLPKSYTDILEYQPALYLRLAATLDGFLARGMNSESWLNSNIQSEFGLELDVVDDNGNSTGSIILDSEPSSIISGQMFDDAELLRSTSNVVTDIQQGVILGHSPSSDLDQIFTHLPLFGEYLDRTSNHAPVVPGYQGGVRLY